jgi:hypothetical protein
MSARPDRVEGTRTAHHLQELPYRQAPQFPASITLPSTAYRLLAELRHRARASTCEVTDQELGRTVNRGERTIQRILDLCESAGLLERRRRYGHRTIRLLFSLKGRAGKTTHALAIRGQPSEDQPGGKPTHALANSDDCTRRKLPMHSPEMSGSPDPSIRRETPSSSLRGSRADDDETAAPDQDPRTAALDLARAHLPTRVADQLAGDVDRLGAKLEGRWDCVAAAVAMLAGRTKVVRSPLAWIVRTAQDYARHGISAEATAARAQLDAQDLANRTARARLEASATADRDRARAEPTAEDLAQFRAWAAGRGGPALVKVGRQALASLGLPVDPE